MKKICLTFDYELFFGKSGTLYNSIIKPTNELIKVFDTFGIKATFFIDVLYYQRLLEVNIEEAKSIKTQLQLLLSKGHRIELHLHPHWLDAKYENAKWVFPHYDHYRLQSLPEEMVTDLIISGCEILNKIAADVVENYKVIAFRAGGWCIVPFDKLKQGFLKSGIKIDSSVAYGMKIMIPPFNVDFKKAPNLPSYKFLDDPTKSNSNGIFNEIPISTYRRNNYNKILAHIFWFYFSISNDSAYKMFGDGSSIPIKQKINLKAIFSKFIPSYAFLSIEDISPYQLLYNIRKTENDLLVIMSHPKNISQSSFECIKALYLQSYIFCTLNDQLNK